MYVCCWRVVSACVRFACRGRFLHVRYFKDLSQASLIGATYDLALKALDLMHALIGTDRSAWFGDTAPTKVLFGRVSSTTSMSLHLTMWFAVACASTTDIAKSPFFVRHLAATGNVLELRSQGGATVSYTHLTLPTIYSV